MTKAPDPTDKHVGSRVRMRRLMVGMRQTKLAEALGITFQQVQKYEKGTNRISSSRLQNISNLLQVPVGFFFDGAPQATGGRNDLRKLPSPAYVSEFLATSDGHKLMKSFMLIKDRKLRRSIVHLVEGMAADE
jgi:transcriptional regulator with XRE-family HTH domain